MFPPDRYVVLGTIVKGTCRILHAYCNYQENIWEKLFRFWKSEKKHIMFGQHLARAAINSTVDMIVSWNRQSGDSSLVSSHGLWTKSTVNFCKIAVFNWCYRAQFLNVFSPTNVNPVTNIHTLKSRLHCNMMNITSKGTAKKHSQSNISQILFNVILSHRQETYNLWILKSATGLTLINIFHKHLIDKKLTRAILQFGGNFSIEIQD